MKKLLAICCSINVVLVVCIICLLNKNDKTEQYTDINYRITDNVSNYYDDVSFADTAEILEEIYAQRDSLCSSRAMSANLCAEIELRLKIYNLELDKTNAALPPHMRTSKSEGMNRLDFFYDTTVKYYQTLYGKEEDWNYCYAQMDVIKELKEMTKSVREHHKDAVEIFNQ